MTPSHVQVMELNLNVLTIIVAVHVHTLSLVVPEVSQWRRHRSHASISKIG